MNKNVRVHLSIPKSDLIQFDGIAQERRISRAALMRECVLRTIRVQLKE